MEEEQKGSRLQQLRQHQQEHVLTVAEQAELTLLEQEIEAAEATYLKPATERLRREREAIEAQNRTLEVLVLRRQALVQRLRDFLAEAELP